MTTGFVDRYKGKMITANTYTSAGGLFYASVVDGITATPAGTQGSSVKMTSMINRVTTAASGSAILLMPGIAGLEITVINAGLNTVKVFATGSDTIDTIAGATGIAGIPTLKTANFYCATNGAWHSQMGT